MVVRQRHRAIIVIRLHAMTIADVQVDDLFRRILLRVNQPIDFHFVVLLLVWSRVLLNDRHVFVHGERILRFSEAHQQCRGPAYHWTTLS